MCVYIYKCIYKYILVYTCTRTRDQLCHGTDELYPYIYTCMMKKERARSRERARLTSNSDSERQRARKRARERARKRERKRARKRAREIETEREWVSFPGDESSCL